MSTGAHTLLLLLVAVGPEVLPPEAVLERALGPGEEHVYQVALQAGEHVRITVAPQGFDVVAAVRDPSGNPLIEIDTPGENGAAEVVSLVAERGGLYGLTVRPAASSGRAGTYRLESGSPRPAGADDRLRVRAEWAAAEAVALSRRRGPDDLDRALALSQEALALQRRLGDHRAEAAVLESLARVHLLRNDSGAARSAGEESLALRRRLGDGRGAASALNQIGRASRRLGDPARALAAFTEALSSLEAGDPELEATLRNNLALVHQETGKPREALAALRQALDAYRRDGDLLGEAKAHNNIGGLSSVLGEPTAAFESYGRALDLARRLQDPALEAELLNNLGDLHVRVGQLHAGLEKLSAALALYQKLGDVPRQAVALNNLGNLLLELGAVEEGRERLEKAVALQPDKRVLALCLLNLSRAARAQDRLEEAVELGGRALALQRETGDATGEGVSLHTLAMLELDAGRPGPAAERLQAALAIFRRLGSRDREAAALRSLGSAQAVLEDPEAAGTSWAEALRLAEALGDVREQGVILRERARAAAGRGDFEGARRDVEAALERFESLRAEVSGERLRATFLASVHETYELAVDVLMRLHAARPDSGFAARAWEVAERSRARALLDFLARSAVEVRAGDPGLRAEERRLRQELAARSARRMELLRDPEKAGGALQADQEIESLAVEYRLVEARLRAGDPRYAALRGPAIDLAGAQRLLDADTALLAYALGTARSWLWVITASSLSVFELPGRDRIEELARQVHEHLRTPAGAGPERADLAELSRLLLEPALAGLAGKRLAVVADGALRYVPFAVLPVAAPEGGSVPLVVPHEVVHLPSAAVLREIRRAAAGRSRPAGELAVFADPVYERGDPRMQNAAADPLRSVPGKDSLARLSWSRREAERIAAAAGKRDVLLALDFQASRELALSPEVARYRVVHFATHGLLDEDHPELSGLALSGWTERGEARDGFLRLQDVYGLELSAGLVVLSGCETALGRRVRGEGLLGLTHGFLHAGAAQVVASLWEVRDRATAELMERFYRALYGGLPPAAALRRAQVEMWSERAWRDPYHWAAFTLQGDWRALVPFRAARSPESVE